MGQRGLCLEMFDHFRLHAYFSFELEAKSYHNEHKILNSCRLIIYNLMSLTHTFFVYHTLQGALESEQEARIVQIDFNAAIDRVNHQGFLYKL